MATLTKKQRDALPADDFGDPARRLFPIVDAGDVSDAAHLIGKAHDPEAVKARIIAIAKRKGFASALPDAWTKQASTSAPFAADSETILWRGKVWEAGDYPAKDYAMTPEELLAAVADFAPCPVDLEHTPTVLSGKLGQLTAVTMGDDPFELYGEVEFPKWLDDALGASERKVSANWDRASKQLTGLALVIDPAVHDAALVAAFAARHDTHAGQAAIQELHDVAARNGAVCKQANASMSSAHEMSALQQMHDTATQHGARCSAMGKGSPAAMYAAAAPIISVPTPRGGSPMSWLAEFFKIAKTAPEGFDPDAAFAAAPAAAAVPVAAAPTAPAVDTEKDTLRAELARERAKGIARDAASFADRIIEIEHRAFPAEREAIVSAYTQAAADDVAYPGTVSFANGTPGTRVAMLSATYAARPAHQLTMEQLGPEMHALFNRQVTDNPNDPNRKPTREEKDALLAMTPLGQTHLRDRARNGSN